MLDIKDILTRWSNWSGSCIGTEYKSAWPIATASSDIRPMLSDEDGEIVDRAVGQLKVFDPLGYDIAKRHYCDNSQLYFFAAYHGISCNRF